MSRSTLAATLVASASAIVYPNHFVGIGPEIEIDNLDYPMIFRWPEEGYRCGATMISDRMAITAAHCFFNYEDPSNPNLTVKLADDYIYKI